MSLTQNASGLTDTEERAVKLEALHHEDGLYPPHIQRWIDCYNPSSPLVQKSHRVKTAARKRLARFRSLVSLSPMRPSLPADLCWEIGLLSTSATRARLLAVSRQTYILLVPLLYRDISVADNAHALVHTLATSPDLAFLVKSLKFRDSRYATVNHSEWAVALPQLVNLRVLTTSYYIPLDVDVISKITFRLWSFTAFTVVTGAWARFLAMQNHLRDLILHSDFMGPVPTPQMLPNLRRLKARYYDVSKFGQHSGLTNIWFYLADPTSGPALSTRVITALSRTTARPTTLRVNGPQMLMILDRAPGLMEKVHHLTLDEDRGWCRFTANAAVLRIAVALDHRLPSLETLTMHALLSIIRAPTPAPAVNHTDSRARARCQSSYGLPRPRLLSIIRALAPAPAAPAPAPAINRMQCPSRPVPPVNHTRSRAARLLSITFM
ncbi:hypothetical protein B0H16DRAFT_1718376 [Mycena metata]|uniref:Uncharacterized protein n=1 Tax=Mycena metata TaxID=1033252 RepID=A0AAD7NK46_9AGAR|nr:hypothetical protein B0H16DRAFT_1718376 [Mycena metata]